MLLLPMMTFDTPEERDKFTAIYENTSKILFGYAYSILNDQGLSEDAVHEAFLRLSKNLGKVGDPDCKKTTNFMITLVKNASLTILKKANRIIEIDFQDQKELLPNDLPTPEDYCVQNESYIRLHDAINQLSDTYRETIKLKYFNEFSNAEIAELQGVTENNIYVRLFRAQKLMLDYLKEGGTVKNG